MIRKKDNKHKCEEEIPVNFAFSVFRFELLEMCRYALLLCDKQMEREMRKEFPTHDAFALRLNDFKSGMDHQSNIR